VMMPGMDGFQVLEHLHAVTDIPVIMLTAMGQDANQIRGMDKGAADFITKGVNMDVLISRIRARLRGQEERRPQQGPRHFDDQLEVDVPRRHLRVADEPVYLTPLQWRLLAYFIENEGRVVSYQKLLDAGWDNPDYGDRHSVKVQISILRGRLHDSPRNSRYIHTLREEGYMFQVRND
jgi:DNA-binding response OmpR family regulator